MERLSGSADEGKAEGDDGTAKLDSEETVRRKREHLDIVLREDVEGWGEGNGFDRYRFRHNAVPELSFADIDLSLEFLGRRLRAPFLVSSMTGGTDEAGRINARLARAAESRGWAMGVGSLRAALENADTAASFRVRDLASSVPLLANLGAVQLNYGFGAEECRRAVDLIGADALVLHLNGMQELFQTGGNTNFAGLLGKIERLCKQVDFPVGAKEVGYGIDGVSARALAEAGIAFVDVAGAGGTSWIKVEKFRTRDPVRRSAADAFEDWGIPTAECVAEVRAAVPRLPVIASGGMASGADAAKAVALGADLAGFGRKLLESAAASDESVEALFARLEFELRAAMFGIGAGSLAELRETRRLFRR